MGNQVGSVARRVKAPFGDDLVVILQKVSPRTIKLENHHTVVKSSQNLLGCVMHMETVGRVPMLQRKHTCVMMKSCETD